MCVKMQNKAFYTEFGIIICFDMPIIKAFSCVRNVLELVKTNHNRDSKFSPNSPRGPMIKYISLCKDKA